MKKIIFIVVILLSAHNVNAIDTLYYSVLRKSIEQAHKDYKMENYRQLANCSERILLVYKDDWLPYYYGAYAYANMSFIETDENNKETFCDKARDLLNDAMKIKPDESELFVLRSLVCFARMAISPMINGPLYLPKANNALNDAERLDPENPRVYYMRGKSTMNTPKFFGGGKELALPVFEKALIKFREFKPKSTLHPSWGKEDAERLYKECRRDSLKAEN